MKEETGEGRPETGERKTAEQWNAQLGTRIVDWDGFRNHESKELFTREEFERRARFCTRECAKFGEALPPIPESCYPGGATPLPVVSDGAEGTHGSDDHRLQVHRLESELGQVKLQLREAIADRDGLRGVVQDLEGEIAVYRSKTAGLGYV